MELPYAVLAVTIGMLAAIAYSLRVLILMEKRIARMEMHIENLLERVMKKERKIEEKVSKK
ncbi:MAG: hypothetical protein KAK00_04295 [Nanoarchaeota archaeon]|nr:hypothetical protein [Nanoarchaeota archaeon]